MSRHTDDWAAAGLPALLEYSGEDVVYKPRGGAPRTITVLVNRNPPAYTVDGQVVSPKVTIAGLNSATDGIASTELELGGDKVTVSVRPGKPAQDFAVHLPKNGPAFDAAQFRLELY